jgi:hypothetical protein
VKDRLHNLFDLARPLVVEVVTDARDTVGWVVDKGRAVVDKVTDLSPVEIVRKADLPAATITSAPGGEYVWKTTNDNVTITGGTTT